MNNFWLLVAITSCILSITQSSRLIAEAYPTQSITLTKLFPADNEPQVTFDDSVIASTLLDVSQGRPLIIVPVSDGHIVALESQSGEKAWDIQVPTMTAEQQVQIISTPVIVKHKLVILFLYLEKGLRTSHRLAVLDLKKIQWDTTFPLLELTAEVKASDGVSTVKFNPATAFSRSALKYTEKSGSLLGVIYAAFGNSGDSQPYHGWLFEIDMNAWQNEGAEQAISHVLLTTPESTCPVSMEYGNQEMICGGGIWTPTGPQIYPTADSFELLVATGNGQVDLDRHDYANSIMRLQPGLQFDSGCDEQLCQNFNPVNPDQACMESCKNLFIPRLAEGNPPLKPANNECDNKTFWECLAWMDFDLGGSAPIQFNLKSGKAVIVQAGKDGAVYLIDADHLGTQYDRLPIVDLCGTPTDACKASWMGMIVTHPVLTYINQEPVIIIPTFVPDQSHPAGLVALKIFEESGKPKFKPFWAFPDRSTIEAVASFRSHPSLPVMSDYGKRKDGILWIVDIATHGVLYGIRVMDGSLAVKQTLLGTGRPLAAPLIYNNILYLASSISTTGKAFIEAYQIRAQP